MAEPHPSSGRIRFGAFEADLASQELFKDGQRIPLANQSFIALAALLERPGQLVTREELRRRIWPDNRVVEFDQGLNAVINRLREAMGTAPGGESLIETLPRRGYRLAGTLSSGPSVGPRNRTVIFGLTMIFALAAGLAAVPAWGIVTLLNGLVAHALGVAAAVLYVLLLAPFSLFARCWTAVDFALLARLLEQYAPGLTRMRRWTANLGVHFSA